MILRPPQLDVANALVAQLPELGDDDVDQLGHGLVGAARIDAQRAGVLIGGQPENTA